jgi:hypothetical protein
MIPDRGAAPGRLALASALALCAAAAFWVAEGVAPWNADQSNIWHHYEYMTEGFLSGHTYLSLEPAPALLSLRDPYDPAANARYRLWDASLYRGKYYLYYGPTPALALMAPWRLVTGHMLPQRLAVAAAAAAGMLALGLFLWEVRRRCFPRLRGAALAGVLLVAFHAAWLPVILRRPGVWELPIVCAAACLWWSLYFLWKFHDSGGKARWAVATGIALALLMGSRATFVFAAGAVAALALARPAGPVPRPRALRRPGLPALALAFAGGAALLVYNHERFGRWLEFGQNYQLWGTEYRGLHLFSPRFILFNARTYLFSLPRFGPYFPFLHPFWPEILPAEHMGTEEIYGVLFMMPVHLAGLGACAWAWRGRADPARRPAAVAVAAAAASSVLSSLVLFNFGGVCSRYVTELMAGWTLVTCVGLMALFGSAQESRPGRLVRALATLAACWSIACVWLASAEFRGFMRQTNPGTYRIAAHALDYPSAWWAARNGITYGPVDLDVRVPPVPTDQGIVLLASGRPERTNQLLLDIPRGGTARLTLADDQHAVLVTPVLPVDGVRLRLRVAAPWLYPPRESPYWDPFGESAVRSDLQERFSIQWDSGGVSTRSVLSNDPTAFRPTVRTVSETQPDTAYVASVKPAPTP